MSVRIEGYGSLFGIRDLSGDVVRPGAFGASLREIAGAGLPMLLEHDPLRPIGRWTRLSEDPLGLFLTGEIDTHLPAGPRTAVRVSDGRLTGLSIGFVLRRARMRIDGGRDLLALELVEISLVSFPMLREARARIAVPVSSRAA